MDYKITKKGIELFDRENFNPKHILECGQIFRYQSGQTGYKILAKNIECRLICEKDHDIISTNNPMEFVHFFDLNRDYAQIKKELSIYPVLEKAIKYGRGIRILNQDPFEMLLSFIISTNNNIPRIQKIIERLCVSTGQKNEDNYAFPTLEALKTKDVGFFREIGAGYRAKYLVNVIDALANGFSLDIEGKTIIEARKHIMNLSGVGRKVADCVLLFAYHKTEVFPTDTWIEKIYDEMFGGNKLSAIIKADNLSKYFGPLSGYAQQYLFYYQRNKTKLKFNCNMED